MACCSQNELPGRRVNSNPKRNFFENQLNLEAGVWNLSLSRGLEFSIVQEPPFSHKQIATKTV